MSILHLSIPSLATYVSTHALQTHLVRHLLSLKSLSKPLPPPVILTMELLPTFTFGRRQFVSPEDRKLLSHAGAIIKSQRGGMTTYHGPGQLNPKCYVHSLESSIIQTCAKYGIEAFRTKDTGVWCNTPSGEEKKIGSIGIHLRRNITSHGVGINITNDVMKYFDMIDACGLGKGVTTLEGMGVQNKDRNRVEKDWVEVLGEELDCDVYKLRDVGELEEIWGLTKGEILDLMIQRMSMNDRVSIERVR